MSAAALVQFIVFVALLFLTVGPLGRYLAAVYSAGPGERAPGDRFFAPVERILYQTFRVDPAREQRWNVYAVSLLAFSAVSMLTLYVLQRLQGELPLNRTDAVAVPALGAFNVAVSFVTNTNWQWYAGESTMSHLTQMIGLGTQNFVSAAAGMAVAVAMIRGLVRREGTTLGNFWVDLCRTVLRVLLPLSVVVAVALVAGGVVQNLSGFTSATPIDAAVEQAGTELVVPGGPVASQVAIKQLGSNGGGFFNANSAHPFENPTGVTNLIQMWAIVVLPLALVSAYGHMLGSRRQARMLGVVMVSIWLAISLGTMVLESTGNPRLDALGVEQAISSQSVGGNLEGKEVRFGPATCGLWAGATTGTSNGSVNCMHDSMNPLSGGAAMAQMMLGEISPGGLGVGLMGMLIKVTAAHPGKLVTQRALLDAVWGPGHEDTSGFLRVHMNHLRHKLEPDPSRPRYFLTEPGIGYRFLNED